MERLALVFAADKSLDGLTSSIDITIKLTHSLPIIHKTQIIIISMGFAAVLEQSTSLLLMMIIMLVMRSVVETADFPIGKPGCDASCGNVSIPFPFGITKDCSLNADFLIDCNRSFIGTGYTPFLRNKPFLNMSITSISIETSQLTVLQDVPAVACEGPHTGRDLKPFTTTPFTIDSSSNLLITKGCNILSIFRGTTNVDGDPPAIIGCVASCNYEFQGESCSRGIGCCLSSIPPGLVSFNAWLYGLHDFLLNNTSVSRDNSSSCAFAFIAHKSVLDGSGQLNMTHPLKPSSMVPIVLNWFVFNDTCESVVKNSSKYACKEGSYCRNIEEAVGYRCSCSPGYQGNPYLGCTDIDECDTSNHGCDQICRNEPGSYICECFPGYSIFGFKNETRCIQVKHTKSVAPIAVIGGTTSGILVVLATTYLLYKSIKKQRDINRRKKFFKINGGHLLEQLRSNGNNIEKVHIFTAKELNKATDNFNENRVLGRGGQGTVYKGMLSDGKIIAVKKSKLVDANQVEQFINEVVILSQIDHRNVVKVLGCCLETEVPLLVYEYVPNGTLHSLIHSNEGDEFPLSWEIRLRIAKEVARALSYLHSTTSIPVYHRDIKSSNILLDEKYRSKVSDFGISRNISVDQTHLTTLVKGTQGYLDPEYFQSSQFTDKSDVYSFGILVVELLTGRQPTSLYWVEEEECHVSLASKFLKSMEDNSLQTILDVRVQESVEAKELEVVAKVVRNCLNLDGRKRPTMTQVVMELEVLDVKNNLANEAINHTSPHAESIGTTRTPVGTTSSTLDTFTLLSDTFDAR